MLDRSGHIAWARFRDGYAAWPHVVFGCTVHNGNLVEIELVADAERLDQPDLTIL